MGYFLIPASALDHEAGQSVCRDVDDNYLVAVLHQAF